MAHTSTREPVPEPADRPPPPPAEGRGCLYALSQPPLMLFLTVVGTLLLLAGAHDQFLL
ncbi:hypothetical protein [Streptomyces specialis]|uniref:hypothetical protein n=1 Tax=Streptomyces specialis TaxID=498367 RepID=UPI0018FED95E|nr:hypothetical protein [Streptomyces specialis]